MAWTPVGLALDELAETVAASQDIPQARSALAEVVRDLEHAVGATLGRTDTDPSVLLVRRFARAHRLVLAEQPRLDVDRVRRHVQALCAATVPAPPARTPTSTPVGA